MINTKKKHKMERRMTEQQLIARMKKKGFELYKTKGIKARLSQIERLKGLLKAIQHYLDEVDDENGQQLSVRITEALTNKTEKE